MRRELVVRLREKQPDAERILFAVYECADEGDCDPENIVYCNVDPFSDAFAHLARQGLRFERAFSDPRAKGHAFPHLLAYELVEADAPYRHWRRGDTFASWAPIPCPDPSTITRAAPFWWLFRTTRPIVLGTHSVTGPFGIRLIVDGPLHAGSKIASLLKPAIDGATSALACDDGSSPVQGVEILARHLGRSSLDVAAMLREGPDLLGRSRLLDRAGRIQAPDQRCVLGELVVSKPASTAWSVSAELFVVEPA